MPNGSSTVHLEGNASFPEYLSFKGLRELGIAHCQGLGSDLWTDFNLHDPGLTILEALCYALTDLGYRTSFPIEDLVARSPKQKNLDEAASIPPGAACAKPFDDNFFTPEQILTCNPVTMLDLRKLLIDIPGVRNAWLERADAAEVPLYLNEETTSLQYEVPQDLVGDDARIAKATVSPDGLYMVHLELDGDEEADACGRDFVPVDRILEDVWTLLHSHRNLCEDFIDVVILGVEDIAVCADIEIEASANPDDVLLEMYKRLEAFLSPALNFYTLQEMLARGKRIEEIYAGRCLTPLAKLVDRIADGTENPGCSHGFIDTEELAATERRAQLHVSDLYQVIMDVAGVLAVRKLLVVNYVNGIAQTRGEKWCLHLTPKHRQRFDLHHSQVQFFKGLLPFSASEKTVAQRYKEEREASTKALLAAHQLDLPVPEGTYRDLQDYRSIIHELPLVYGIGEGGVPESATAERKAQVQQLRAYLLFYDQILANYLAQLANLRGLFSICPDRDRMENRTYFTQILGDIPQIEELLQSYNQCRVEDGYPAVPESYPDYLDSLVESRETYHARRNRFLDHLLARFAESFTDYVLLMFDVNGSRNDEDRIIGDKTGFLSTYPETSRNRGKGFDYTDPVIWSTNNVSGLERRVARLLGIANSRCRSTEGLRDRAGELFSRRTLSLARVVEVESAWRWKIELPGVGDDEPVTLTSRLGFRSELDASEALNDFRERAADERNIRRLAYEDFRRHGFAVVAGPDELVLAEVDRPWPDPVTRDLYLYRLMRLAIGGCIDCELDQETECHFYQLLGAHGVNVVFAGARGYPTESEAYSAFELDILGRASFDGSYRDLDEESGFGFELLSESGGVLATHPPRYETADERSLRKLAILYYVSQPAIRTRIDGEPGAFGFDVRDLSGEVLFESAIVYPTKDAASAGYRELLRRARQRASYRPVDNLAYEGQFGFELVGDDGEVLARHPPTYPTAIARDLAIDFLIRLFCPVEDVRWQAQEKDGDFAVALLAEDGTGLLVSAATYESHEEAHEALQIILDVARQRDRYVLIEDDGAYGFVLHDMTSEVLAIHPATYAHAVERDLALRGIISYVCPAAVTYSIDGEPGRFQYLLLDPNDHELFRSIETYCDESTARSALEAFLDLAVEESRYRRIGETGAFGFELLGDESLIAEHTERYATAEEREAAIAMIIAYLSRAEIQHRIDNPRGAFQFELRDESGDQVLSGTDVLPNVELAKAAYKEARALARDRERYRCTEDGPCGCPFGFEIVGKRGAVVARDPRRYASTEQRDEAMRRLYALVHDGSTIPDVVCPEYNYGLVLRDHAGNVMLQSVQTYETREEAEQASENLRNLAADAGNYGPIDDEDALSFQLNDGERCLARHPTRYATAEERDAALQDWLEFLLSFTREPKVVNVVLVPVRFFYHLIDFKGDELLRSTRHWPSADEAESAFRKAFVPLAQNESNYERIYGNKACTYTFELRKPPADSEPCLASKGDLLAEHAPTYTLPQARDEQLQRAVDLVRAQRRDVDFSGVICGHFFRLLGDSDELISTSYYPDAARAASACTRLLPRLAIPEAYVIEPVDEESHRLIVACADNTVRAASAPGGYDELVIMRDALVALAAKETLLPHELEEASAEYRCRLTDAGGETLLESAHGHSIDKRREACEACNQFIERAQEPDAFRLITASGTCAYGFELIDEDRRTLARYPRFFASASERDEHIGAIQCLADTEGFHLVEHLLLRPRESGMDPAYGFALSDAQSGKVLVQSLGILTDRDTAVEMLMDLVNGILAGEDIVKTVEVDQSFGFYVEGENGAPIASPESLFCSKQDRDAARDFFLDYVATELKDPASRHKDALDAFVFDIRTKSEAQRDALIPLGRGCRDAKGNLCPVRSDPYSFRVTVVVPYWPKRFRRSDFRPFFEHTLRLEAPAHIFPRICWVDVCQMQAFEDAYRRWLGALAHPTGDCDLTAAQEALVHILFDLKSVYSTARLFGCESDGVTNPVRLDQTILGTAGTDHGDSS